MLLGLDWENAWWPECAGNIMSNSGAWALRAIFRINVKRKHMSQAEDYVHSGWQTGKREAELGVTLFPDWNYWRQISLRLRNEEELKSLEHVKNLHL